MADYESSYSGEQLDEGIKGGLDFADFKPVTVTGDLTQNPIEFSFEGIDFIVALENTTEVKVTMSSDTPKTVNVISERFGGQSASNLSGTYNITSTPTEISTLTFYPLILSFVRIGQTSYFLQTKTFLENFSDLEITIMKTK